MDASNFPLVDAIKAAGSNPLALAAFALFVAALFIVSLRVRRNKNLLDSLEKIPEKDRLAALKLEMGAVRITGGLTADQWLKQNSRQYLLGALVVICITLVVLASVVLSSIKQPTPASGIRIELAPPPASAASGQVSSAGHPQRWRSGLARIADWLVSPAHAASPPAGSAPGVGGANAVSYQSQLEKDGPHIMYSAPYLDRVAAGGPVNGFNHFQTPFDWYYPELAMTVVNNGRGVMVLSEARVEVLEADPVNEVIPLLEDLSINRLVVVNEGWATVVSPHLEFSVSPVLQPGEVQLFQPQTVALDLPSFADRFELPLKSHVPDTLRRESAVLVQGTLTYGEPSARKSVRFKTRVALQLRAGVGMTASQTYNLRLQAGRAGIVRQVGLSQEIKPGSSDLFKIRVASDRTARYRLRVSFVTASGDQLPGGDIRMDIFVPRSSIKPE